MQFIWKNQNFATLTRTLLTKTPAPNHSRTTTIGLITGLLALTGAMAQTPEELFELRSTLHSEPLHDIPVPDGPDRFWIEIDGVIHEGDIRAGFCAATLSGVTAPTPAAQDRFSASASWRDAEGGAWQFEIRRVLFLDAGAWRAGRHENDAVTLHHRADGNLNRVGSSDFDPDAGVYWLSASAQRGRPGDQTIRHSRGPDPFPGDQFPIIRVSEDGLRATAAGTLKPPLSAGTDEPQLPFRMAVRCSG